MDTSKLEKALNPISGITYKKCLNHHTEAWVQTVLQLKTSSNPVAIGRLDHENSDSSIAHMCELEYVDVEIAKTDYPNYGNAQEAYIETVIVLKKLGFGIELTNGMNLGRYRRHY